MTQNLRPAMIWCPFPDSDSARLVANTLLDEGLVACVNIMGQMTSLYIWDGQREEATEVGALFKTTEHLLRQATDRIAHIHPYSAPAVQGWVVDYAAEPTLKWLSELEQK